MHFQKYPTPAMKQCKNMTKRPISSESKSSIKEPASKKHKYDWNTSMQSGQLHILRKQDLQIYLKEHHLRISGKKQTMIDRIKRHILKEKAFNAACSDIRSIFDHPKDHKQFISILLPIEQSKMIKILDVPSVIATLISQYSTGQIKRCAGGRSCRNEIAFIQKEYSTLIERDTFRHSRHNDVYFCKQCKHHTTKCIDCATPQWDRDCHWCAGCDDFICFNAECENYPVDGKNYSCVDCAMVFCSKSPSCQFIKNDYGELVCHDCYDDDSDDECCSICERCRNNH